MKVAFGRLHKGGLADEGGQPTFVEIITGDKMCIRFVRVCISSVGLINPPAPMGGLLIHEGRCIRPAVGFLPAISNLEPQQQKEQESHAMILYATTATSVAQLMLSTFDLTPMGQNKDLVYNS